MQPDKNDTVYSLLTERRHVPAALSIEHTIVHSVVPLVLTDTLRSWLHVVCVGRRYTPPLHPTHVVAFRHPCQEMCPKSSIMYVKWYHNCVNTHIQI